MGLCNDVRTACAEIAGDARWVSIDLDALDRIEPGPEPELDPERHYLNGPQDAVAHYLLTLDTINFGSGWFPTLVKRPRSSGYFTVAWSLADRYRAHGPYSNDELRAMTATEMAGVIGQPEGHQLMELFAEALRQLGEFLGDRTALDVVDAANGSAEALAQQLADGMPFYRDTGFYKRAQITPNDLTLAGIATFDDIDNLTIFADNLVPHVLRMDGVLKYDAELSEIIDSEKLLPPGECEREIRACALHACEQIAERLSVPARDLDVWLWNRGQDPHYKARPRHRTRTVYY
jgi:hypothetical protein